MAEVRVVVCDICSAYDAERYRIGKGKRTRQLDLCEEHAKPIEELLRLRLRPRAEDAIASLDEIERLKAEGKA